MNSSFHFLTIFARVSFDFLFFRLRSLKRVLRVDLNIARESFEMIWAAGATFSLWPGYSGLKFIFGDNNLFKLGADN